jgi:hypothetical protein
MAGHGRKDDEAIIFAMAAGATVAGAAEHAKVSEKTVRRRLANPDFRRRVAEARSEMLVRAVGRLSIAGVQTVDDLIALRSASSESVRLGACRALLEFLFKGNDAVILEQRIQALEAAEQARAAKEWTR